MTKRRAVICQTERTQELRTTFPPRTDRKSVAVKKSPICQHRREPIAHPIFASCGEDAVSIPVKEKGYRIVAGTIRHRSGRLRTTAVTLRRQSVRLGGGAVALRLYKNRSRGAVVTLRHQSGRPGGGPVTLRLYKNIQLEAAVTLRHQSGRLRTAAVTLQRQSGRPRGGAITLRNRVKCHFTQTGTHFCVKCIKIDTRQPCFCPGGTARW